MKNWWLTLNQRERQLVFAGGVAVVAAILYWGIWSPLSHSVENTTKQLKQQKDTLVWAKAQGERILSAGVGRVNSDHDVSENPSQAINRSAARQVITISKMQPRGDGIDVWIDDVEFNRLMTWLAQLQQQYGLKVESLDLVAQETAGHVKVRRLKLGSGE